MHAEQREPQNDTIPEPERWEPKLADPKISDLTTRDWMAIAKRSVKETLDDSMPLVASAVAYSSFFAIPSLLLLAVGVFSLVASPETIGDLMDRFSAFMPGDAVQLLQGSLERLEQQPSQGVLMVVLGFVLALWASTSAMTTYMTALNMAYDRKDGRSFVRKRLVALAMVVAVGAAVLLVGLFLIFGPYIQRFVGDLLGIEGAMGWIWWSVQWPLLFVGLLLAFAVLHYFGPDVDHPRWQLVTPGSVVAVIVWIASSGIFALYTAYFGNYNKAWGSFSAVIVTLTWLWLTAIALLFGGEVNAEVERSRELRKGVPAGEDVQAPRRSDES